MKTALLAMARDWRIPETFVGDKDKPTHHRAIAQYPRRKQRTVPNSMGATPRRRLSAKRVILLLRIPSIKTRTTRERSTFHPCQHNQAAAEKRKSKAAESTAKKTHLSERLRGAGALLLPRGFAVGPLPIGAIATEEGGRRHRARRPETRRKVAAAVRPGPRYLFVRELGVPLLPLVLSRARIPRLHGAHVRGGGVRGWAAVYTGPGDLAVERPRRPLFVAESRG